jgi:fibronectin-binding autotransporter adhesin
MKIMKSLEISLLSIALLAASLANSPAQTTATWTGSGGDGLWNTGANWDIGVPAEGTNALIGNGNTVNYNSPMVATSIGSLFMTNVSSLNINASGFITQSGNSAVPGITVGAVTAVGGTLNINSGGTVTVTNSGPLYLGTNGTCVLTNGGTLLVTNSLASDGMLVGDNKRYSIASYVALFRMDGGTATVDRRVTIAGSTSGTAGSQVIVNGGVLNLLGGCRINNTTDDGGCRFLVNGGNVNLGGTFSIYKSSGNPTAGLVISNGVVNATGIQIGIGNSRAIGAIYGGVLTNTGIFTISDTTNAATSGERRSRFFVLGGTVVSTTPEGIIVGSQTNNAPATSSVIGGILDVSAGTVFANGITLVRDNTIHDAYGTFNLSGTGIVYLGSVGLVGNRGPSGSGYFVNFNGGTLAAQAAFSINTTNTLGTATTTIIQAADANNNPFNISASGPFIGGGNLKKTGGGTLLLGGTNTYSGFTLVNGGTLALGANGLIASPFIFIGTGSSLDVSAQAGAFSPGATLPGQTLSGFGSVSGLVTATNGIIQPGSNNITGTLTFNNGLTELGNAANKFILSSDPVNGSNDLIAVTGDLTVSGSNTVVVVGTLPNNTNYTLIHYTGNFNGNITNFTLTGAIGFLTNIVATKSITLHTLATTRGPTNIVWVGNAVSNNWDTATTTNWLNVGALDFFIANDSVRFNATGAANTNVNIVGSVLPTLVTVDAVANYSFTGGTIDGPASLTKTNSGTLTIATANNYVGVTTIDGGVLQISNIANGNLSSPIGAANSSSANLVINSGVLRYAGPTTSTDRGATLGSASSAIDVTTNGNLTISGTLIGSGGLNKVDDGTLILSGANTYAGPTTLSNGTLQISSTISALANTVVFAGGTLSLNVGSQQIYSNPYNVATTGTVNSAGSQNNVMQAAWSGSGTLNVRATGGTFTLNADMTTNFTGTIRLTDDSAGTFRFNSGGNSTGPQQCDGSTTATFDLGNSFATLLNRNGGGTNFGTYFLGALAGGTNGTIRGSTANSASTYQIGDKNIDTTYSGAMTNGSGGTGATMAITKSGTGTFTLNGNFVVTVSLNGIGDQITNFVLGNPITYTGPTIISNGVLALVSPVNLSNSPSLTMSSPTAVLDASQMGYVTNALDGDPGDPLFGTLTNYLVTNGVFEVYSGQIWAGIGTVRGRALIDNASTLNAGLPTGSLTITNGIELAGAVHMNVNAAGSPNCSKIVSPTITVDGTAALTVNNLGPEAGATFQLFSKPVSGFASVTLPTLTGTNSWVNNLAVNGSITLVAPPLVTVNTNATNITFAVTGAGNTLTLHLSWPSDHTGWRLLEQTNPVTVGLINNTNNWFEITNAASTNQISVPVTNGTSFFRMIYP